MTQTLVRMLRPKVVLGLLVIAAIVVVVDTYRSISHTWDEPAHLANGLLLLDSGTYIEYQHPPLARLAMAVGPYLAGERAEPPPVLPDDFQGRVVQSFDEGRKILYHAGTYDRVLTLARIGILPFLVLLLGATWVWTRGLLGEWTAVLAVFFVAATPLVLGNAGIATLDLPLTALAITSLLVFTRWLERPTFWSGVALGAVTGASIMVKFSAIPFLALCFIAIALWYTWVRLRGSSGAGASGRERPALLFTSRAHLATVAVALGTLLVVCWLSFGGGFVSLADPVNRPYRRVDDMFGQGTTANRIVSDALELRVVPYFVWAVKEGVKDLSYHNQTGHLSYLLGERGEDGWWNYYLVGLGVRTPLPLLVAGLCGLGLLLHTSVKRGDWRLAAAPLAFLAVLTFVSVYSRINLGIRHILMLYPLLAIGAAHATTRLATARGHRATGVALAGLLMAAHVASAALTHPDHVSYFNAIVASHPERFLITADLDWGQDMKRLERELRSRGIKEVAISFYGSNDLSRHDLPRYRQLPPNTPQRGWVAISIWRLYRNDDFSWLRAYEPVARVGTSVNLYYIEDPSAAAPATPRIGS